MLVKGKTWAKHQLWRQFSSFATDSSGFYEPFPSSLLLSWQKDPLLALQQASTIT
jgi:hypothetical protein